MNMIFDFDGTLADSFNLVLENINVIADEFNFRKVDSADVDKLRTLTSAQFINYLKIPLWKLPRVILRSRQVVSANVADLSTFPDLPSTLATLFTSGVTLGVLTSNSRENVSRFLERHGLLYYFAFIYDEPGFFGKKGALKKIIKENKYDKNKTYYIGDETRDIIAAQKSGIISVAVAWGFNKRETLMAQNPSHLLMTPPDLLRLL